MGSSTPQEPRNVVWLIAVWVFFFFFSPLLALIGACLRSFSSPGLNRLLLNPTSLPSYQTLSNPFSSTFSKHECPICVSCLMLSHRKDLYFAARGQCLHGPGTWHGCLWLGRGRRTARDEGMCHQWGTCAQRSSRCWDDPFLQAPSITPALQMPRNSGLNWYICITLKYLQGIEIVFQITWQLCGSAETDSPLIFSSVNQGNFIYFQESIIGLPAA